jgi:DNA-binding CsgD family transcriptional regulator/PAS domain-containing protein
MDIELVEQIYDAVGDEEVFNALPALIAKAVGVRSCTIFGFDQSLVLKSAIANYLTAEMLEYQLSEDIKPLDIWTEYGARQVNRGRIVSCDEAWDQPTFLRTPYFNEYFRKFGDDTSRCMGGVAPVHGGFVSLAVQGATASRPFGGADVAELTKYSRHVFRVLGVRSRLAAAGVRTAQLQGALDSLAEGVLAVDASLRVVSANRRGMAMLKAAQGLRLAGQRLAAVSHAAQERLHRAVTTAAGRTGGHGDAMQLPRADGAPPYRLVVAPLSGSPGLALVIVDDPADQEPDAAVRFARLFGLTLAEGELAALLAEGHTPEEAAEIRGVRLTTVRTQVKQLLAKTEARRLTDLVRILARAPRVRPPPNGSPPPPSEG